MMMTRATARFMQGHRDDNANVENEKHLSDVGFEPTPSYDDQNTRHSSEWKESLESGALDRSANLTT